MKRILKKLLSIASDLDSIGLDKEADALDSVVNQLAADDNDLLPGNQEMAQVQAAFNKYVSMAGGTFTVEGRSFEDAVPVNGKAGDRTTWTAIQVQFPEWFEDRDFTKPVAFKNYRQLLALIEKEIAALDEKTAEAQTAFEAKASEVLEAWDSLVSELYDPKDQDKYRVKDIADLQSKLNALPAQRGPADELHENVGELAVKLNTALENKDVDLLEQINVTLGGMELVTEED
jgi:hypothetical protein